MAFKLPLLAASAALALNGCTVPPAPPPGVADLTGTRWHVVSVNGRQTPAQGDYSMRFEPDNRIGARFGCNAMGGQYRLAAGTLTVTNLISTMMGCPEPAASFENQGSAILREMMQVSGGGQQMTLASGAGAIVLDRTN